VATESQGFALLSSYKLEGSQFGENQNRPWQFAAF